MGTVIKLNNSSEKVLMAEQIVVGSMLIDRISRNTCLAILADNGTNHFADRQLGVIFEAMRDLADDGLMQDDIVVAEVSEFLHRNGHANMFPLLASLSDNVGSTSSAERMAKQVKENSLLRNYQNKTKILNSELQLAIESGKAAKCEQILEQFELEQYQIKKTLESLNEKEFYTVSDVTLSYLQSLEDREISGIATGYSDLDRILQGIANDSLCYLAARPGIGKSALAVNIAHECNLPVLIFSLEMSERQLTIRQLAMYSGIDSADIRRGSLTAEQIDMLKSAAKSMRKKEIFLYCKPVNINAIKKISHQAVQKRGVKLIIIDYMQLIMGNRGRSRQEEITEISAHLKMLATALTVPVICLAQLNRNVEHREHREPVLSDLRESGSLEQDADVVIFLWQKDKESQLLNFTVAKNRNGRTGGGNFYYNKSTQKIYDCED